MMILRRRLTTTNCFASAYLPPKQHHDNSNLETLFSPSDLKKVQETYLLPPPNVTGKLHMGHALTVTIQDAVARYQRLQGKEVRWIYGLDHAGIATQSVVERNLLKNQNITKFDLGREKFVEKVWEWTKDHKTKIKSQLQTLSATLDYKREYFTLDDNHSLAVKEAFVEFHEKGLLKRAKRMVNWCPQLQTALSDLEVDKMSIDKPTEIIFLNNEKCTFGVADDFAYQICNESNSNEEIVVRTTRLETMLGDVAIAVHPEDVRYQKYVGKFVHHPFIPNKKLPIISDPILVDPSLGTGAVKVTPNHDPNDFLCANRFGLEIGESIFTPNGKMEPSLVPKEFANLSRFEAREKLRQELTKKGLYRGLVNHPLILSRCSRTGDVIEPILKWQWFMDGNTLAKDAQKAVKEQNLTFYPSEAISTWNTYLDSPQDWCISRQLWWGHRIPAYRIRSTKNGSTCKEEDGGWVAARNETEARKKLNAQDNELVEQDEDVLDTWFSSALLPISVFGWPKERNVKHQLTWMETGSDILFFWVARMVMVCTNLNGLLPFKHVHLHSLVRDKKGRKMSKSLGNVIDPLDVVHGISLQSLLDGLKTGNLDPKEVKRAMQDLKKEFEKTNGIPEYGADSLRLGLASYPADTPQILFDLQRVANARIFCNKLWQATRFVHQKVNNKDDHQNNGTEIDENLNDIHIQWIRHRLHETYKECSDAYERLDIETAMTTCKKFILHDFCDVFIECCKLSLNIQKENETLVYCLSASLCLLNPIAPIITEELFHQIQPSSSSMSLQFLKNNVDDDNNNHIKEGIIQQMSVGLDILRAIRSIKLRLGKDNKINEFHVYILKNNNTLEMEPTIFKLIKGLAKITELSIHLKEQLLQEENANNNFLIENLQTCVGYVTIPTEIYQSNSNVLMETERKRIEKQQKQLWKDIEETKTRLDSPSYKEKAPKHIQDKEIERLSNLQLQYETLELAKQKMT